MFAEVQTSLYRDISNAECTYIHGAILMQRSTADRCGIDRIAAGIATRLDSFDANCDGHAQIDDILLLVYRETTK